MLAVASILCGDFVYVLPTGEQAASKPRHKPNIGALVIRTGFWAPLYYNYNKKPPKILSVII